MPNQRLAFRLVDVAGLQLHQGLSGEATPAAFPFHARVNAPNSPILLLLPVSCTGPFYAADQVIWQRIDSWCTTSSSCILDCCNKSTIQQLSTTGPVLAADLHTCHCKSRRAQPPAVVKALLTAHCTLHGLLGFRLHNYRDARCEVAYATVLPLTSVGNQICICDISLNYIAHTFPNLVQLEPGGHLQWAGRSEQ